MIFRPKKREEYDQEEEAIEQENEEIEKLPKKKVYGRPIKTPSFEKNINFKIRTCLKCDKSFKSFDEKRVCARCKNSQSYREDEITANPLH